MAGPGGGGLHNYSSVLLIHSSSADPEIERQERVLHHFQLACGKDSERENSCDR